MNSPKSDSWIDQPFDFDEWVEVYRRDPQAFERRREEWIEAYIQSTPSEFQPRLRGLMFRVNAERRRARNPIDACIRLTGLMWEKFTEMQHELGVQTGAIPPRRTAVRSARIIPFARKGA